MRNENVMLGAVASSSSVHQAAAAESARPGQKKIIARCVRYLACIAMMSHMLPSEKLHLVRQCRSWHTLLTM